MSGTRMQRIKAIFVAASAIPPGLRRDNSLPITEGPGTRIGPYKLLQGYLA